jgi:hypothetical protein
MAQVTTVRIPDEVLAQFPRDRPRSEIILRALDEYFGSRDESGRKVMGVGDFVAAEVARAAQLPIAEVKAKLQQRPAHHPTCRCYLCKPDKTAS